MSDLPIDPIPLGRVFLHPDGPDGSTPDEVQYASLLREAIEREFGAGALAIYGRAPGEYQRKRIFAGDHEIYWAGKKSRRPDVHCEVFARPHIDLDGPWLSLYHKGEMSDLVIARADWDRICAAVLDATRASSDAITPKRGRRGPSPGTVDRYGSADRALFPEIDRLRNAEDASAALSLTAACNKLADDGRVAGNGNSENIAKRLRDRYTKEHRN